ncbi:MAG: acetyl ornithine aminotransferase family protein, partial [Acidobacteria bacterium]|nr:acetyl ornithine aminotransferase family protein [Acidobacteriota bacterium]
MSTIAPPKRPEIKTALPGPKGTEIINADHTFVTPSYPRPSWQLVAERAEGVWVEDVDGNIFLDCNAGVAVCSTGHCHPEIVKAIQEQAARLIHMCGTDYYYKQMPDLARKLDEITPVPSPTRTHFANSGTEAIETALKLAMHATGRQKFIAFFNSFHGRTLGSLSLTSSKVAQRKGFHRQALDVTHVPYPNAFRHPFTGEKSDAETVSRASLDWIENRLFKTTTPPEEVAAIVVEVVQGEGGYVPAPQEFLQGLRRICDEHGILLIVDEVQSGMGRTGKMFACDHYDLKPDVICLAKGIGSGLPIGVTVARADLMNWKPGAHASTFGGNPVCIASALKTIELLEGGLVENSARVGKHLEDGLRKLMAKHDCIGDVRGLGMMLGVEFVTDKASLKPAPELRDKVEQACYERGLIILGAGTNTIRWSPPLILSEENADVALEIFDQAITAACS